MTERGIDKARRELAASRASGEHAEFLETTGKILEFAMAMKKQMVERCIGAATKNCPICGGKDTIHARLITGANAGRHRKSGGAFRMWCSTEGCGTQLME